MTLRSLHIFVWMMVIAFVTMRADAVAPHDDTAIANHAPLLVTPLVSLPLGNVRATGWLLTQLQLQRDGLTGHAERVIPNLGSDSGWLGGTGPHAENWEKGPYYVKGLVALAYTLDDQELKTKAQKWIDWSLNSQQPDGSFGPASNNDWWPRMVMTYALRQYAEATDDPRVVPMLSRYLRYVAANLVHRPLKDWGKSRAGDMIDTAFWVYNRTGDPQMLYAADLMYAQAYDWTDIFTRNQFMAFGNDFQPKHAVNIAQALKMPAVWYQRSRAAKDRDAWHAGMNHIVRGTTLPLDVGTGTEFLSGRSAIQGVETCTVVEQMLSDETSVAILGDPAIADSLERVAYNALPGAMTKDLKLYQYYTPTNHVVATRGGQGFNQDYGDSLMPGPVSGYPCCCYNLHMGWPMLVQHTWMATSDGGLAAVVYGPTTVTATLPGAGKLSILEKTNYPFDGDIHLTVSIAHPATFPLKLRIPAWCSQAKLSINGQAQSLAAAGSFAVLNRQWADGDVVDLSLPMPLLTIPGVNNSISIARGPLVFSLKMPQEKKVVKPDADGFVQLELTSPDPWNYAIAVDPANPAKTVTVQMHPMPTGNPFEPDSSPVVLDVPARRLPAWGLVWTGRCAEDPPAGPVSSDQPLETIHLVPFGAQTLRVTTFPYLGQPPVQPPVYACDFHDVDAPGWVDYGGGWLVARGQLHATSNAGSNSYGLAGVKSIMTDTDFTNFVYDADVTPAESGDSGLLFRISHPAIGANAFDGYYVGIRPGDGHVLIGKGDASDNQWTELASAPIIAKAGVSLHLRVVAMGPNIQVFVDDIARPSLSLVDSSFSHGAIGVRQYTMDPASTHASFGSISVKRSP